MTSINLFKAHKSILAFLLLTSFSLGANAATEEFDVMCRIKAKEIAAEAYQGCVTEAKAQQVDQLKKDYQDKLRKMKEEYESELKRLGNNKSNQSSAAATPTKKMNKKNRSSTPNKLAKSLPTKIEKNTSSSNAVGQNSKNDQDSGSSSDMSIQLKPATASSVPSIEEEAAMDIPEPTPIEDVPTAALDTQAVNNK